MKKGSINKVLVPEDGMISECETSDNSDIEDISYWDKYQDMQNRSKLQWAIETDAESSAETSPDEELPATSLNATKKTRRRFTQKNAEGKKLKGNNKKKSSNDKKKNSKNTKSVNKRQTGKLNTKTKAKSKKMKTKENSKNEKETKSKYKWEKQDLLDISFLRVPSDCNFGQTTPLQYFYSFFSKNCIQSIVEQTNLYSEQKSGKSIELTYDEFTNFLGIIILMGIFKLPSIKDYWNTTTRIPQIANVMTRDRFLLIRSNIHFVNNESYKEGNEDRFFKIRPLLESVLSCCAKFYDESQTYSVDETMIPYKGKMAGSLRQYIGSKPIKWGFKMFVCAGSDGIIYSFLPYQGKATFTTLKNTKMELTIQESELGVGASAVLALAKSIENKQGCVIHCDNFFSSIRLFLHMRDEYGIFCVGTFRSNRIDNCPLEHDKILKKAGRGSYDYRSIRGKMVLVKYFDNKCVIIGSTIERIEPECTIFRWSKEEKKKVEVKCPNLVRKYNQSMGGVDKNNFLVSIYRTVYKSYRWYLPFFFIL